MARLFASRPGHYLLLLCVGGALFFPSLGGHSLWDIDESHNAECAREMMDADNWSVPTFNYVLRSDKPALLYWCMILAYQLFGVSEFAARLWSALAGLGTVIVTYELGRRMFDKATGLLAGIILASAVMFCISSHAATPDALLIFLSTLTLCLFWEGYRSGNRRWLIWIGVSTGFAVLAKGPVGLLLPATTIGLFLVWERRLRLLGDRRLILGLLLFLVIALPWYIHVGKETQGAFLQGFFLKHNVSRFVSPMEGHGSSFLVSLPFHPLAMLAGFAPWSAFLGLTVWYATGRRARQDGEWLVVSGEWASQTVSYSRLHHSPLTTSAYRFLWCWVVVWFVFFSLAGTKLPNYVLPAYPALALLTARFLERWRRGAVRPSAYLLAIALACLALVGAVVAISMVLASGLLDLPALNGKSLPGLAPWAVVGLLPILAAFAGWRYLRQGLRTHGVAVVTVASVLFVGILAAVGPAVVDAHKLPRALATELAHNQVEPDIEIGCYRYYQPALVFYTRRQVQVFGQDQQAIDLLNSPRQTFLFVPAEQWQPLQARVEAPCRVVARRHDFMTGREVLLVTNRP